MPSADSGSVRELGMNDDDLITPATALASISLEHHPNPRVLVDFHGVYPARPGRSTLVESVKRSGVNQYRLQMRPKAYWEIANCCARRAGSITPIKPGPFQIGSREDRARRPCRSPAVLQGLSGIGIPNRKTPARHIGPLCSIRGKSGGGRSGGEP